MATNRNVGPGEPRRGEGRQWTTGERQREFEQPTERVKRKARGVGERIKDRASEMAESRKHQAADRVRNVGDRLEARGESLEAQGGLKGQAGRAVHRAGETIEQGAEYLDTHRLSTIRDDAKHQIVDHPLASVGAALGTGFAVGWLVGKAGGDEEEEFERRERFEQAYGRGREDQGMVGRMGQLVTTALTAMAARAIRNRLAGEQRSRA